MHHHLLEERLFDGYLAVHAGERMDPPTAEHLADCEACAARYNDLVAFLDGLRREGTSEADALFTPARLQTQRQRINERLLHVVHPARIIRFPGRRSVDFVRRSMTTSTAHRSSRWVAAAAAAGLFIGVAVGASYNYGAHVPRPTRFALQSAAPLLKPGTARGDMNASAPSDDAFLSDLEIALERPHTRELLAFDAFTPHARDVGLAR